MNTFKKQHEVALRFNWNSFLDSIEGGIRSLLRFLLALLEFVLSGAKFILEAVHICVTAAKTGIKNLPPVLVLAEEEIEVIEEEYSSRNPHIPIEITNQ